MKNGKQTIIDILNSSYLYLAIGAFIMLFYNGRYIIPLAAWLWPIFFLRFIKKQKILTGIIIGGLTLAAVSIITMYGKIPLKGILYYLIAGSMGTTLLVPFLISKLASYKIKGFASTLALPLAWTSLEYINSCVSPFGTFGSVAYTQYANLPLLQLASVTGMWGIVFLIAWSASVVNWIWDRNFSFQIIWKGAGLYSAILVLVLLFGSLRLSLVAPASYPLRIAAITVPNQYHTSFDEMHMEELYGKGPEEFVNALLKLNNDLKIPEYMIERTSIEAEAGAKLVIWSEGAVPIRKKDEDAFVKQCGNLARDKKIYILMTLVSYLPDFPKQMPENKNIMIDPSGTAIKQYLKSILVPGELGVPGNGIIQVAETDYGRIGSAVCFDMDFPAFIKQAAKKETDIMLAPSSDWPEIEPLHTYQAAFRAVENGFSLVRPVSKGMSAAFDYQGRILAAADYYKTDNVSMTCYIPIKGVTTIYSKIDDTFAWSSLLAFGAMLFILIKRKPVEKM